MRISERFQLNRNQAELDFVDIDTDADVPLFLDPYFLSQRADAWSGEATFTIRSFFQTVIDLITSDRVEEARLLFSFLTEPNQTCLGMSTGSPSGRGVGAEQASDIFNSLLESGAVRTGLIHDIQDTRIFVEGIGKDKLSDMTTNIIRRNLIEYTQNQCLLYEIPLTRNVPSDFFWDTQTES